MEFLCKFLTCFQGIYLSNGVMSRYYSQFVYANSILIRMIKILHKSSFCKTLSCRNFSLKYQALLIFHPQLFLLINTTFIQSKCCIGEILLSLLHSWRNVIPCRKMWLLQSLYNTVKVPPSYRTDIFCEIFMSA